MAFLISFAVELVRDQAEDCSSSSFRDREQEERRRRDFMNSTEIPAEYIDPAAIDLTPLVNTLINTSQSGSRQLFSLLSVTSYSSLALHKLTLLVYNISSIKTLESNRFRRRFCYCVTNETNDLTVTQRNNSGCIYICVMAGKMGREVPDLWEVGSVTPLFNQTIVEGRTEATCLPSSSLSVSNTAPSIQASNVLFKDASGAFLILVSNPLLQTPEWHQLPTNLSHISPSGMSSMLTSRVVSNAHVSPTTPDEKAATTAKISTAQLLATQRQPATGLPQSPTTQDRPETTTTRTTQRWTTQNVATQTMTIVRTTATEITTTSQPTTAADPTTATSQSSTYLLHQPQYLPINHSICSINHSIFSINHSICSINHSICSINHFPITVRLHQGPSDSINHSIGSNNHWKAPSTTHCHQPQKQHHLHSKGSTNHSIGSLNLKNSANNHSKRSINHSIGYINHSKSSINHSIGYINHSKSSITSIAMPTTIAELHQPPYWFHQPQLRLQQPHIANNTESPSSTTVTHYQPQVQPYWPQHHPNPQPFHQYSVQPG
ncbi:hypothetical protein F7725_010963 [Dissostichus mawsoni]|uniref:Uncharacterized protein n=1 Tax=Dissostichus mawsoni TaxID=36200 RepID=A0A7J5Z7H0_DISMA|nr:hypothetical protein F7725_010963 [Dissostichus mawsoni]